MVKQATCGQDITKPAENHCIIGTIIPGYHLNKRHWNTIRLNGTVPTAEILRLIDHSYDLVYKTLPRKLRSGEKEYGR